MPTWPDYLPETGFWGFLLFVNTCNPLMSGFWHWNVLAQLLWWITVMGWCQICVAERFQPDDDPRGIFVISASENFASCPKITGNCTKAVLFWIRSPATQQLRNIVSGVPVAQSTITQLQTCFVLQDPCLTSIRNELPDKHSVSIFSSLLNTWLLTCLIFWCYPVISLVHA